MDIPLLQKALLQPAIYPDQPKEVGFAETHISLLFFTGTHVYKVKKPVNFGFLDFTSLEKRKYFCEQEVRLNRRLAPELYLGVVPITQEQGGVALQGKGPVIDYAVKMKQISEERLMDKLLARHQVTPK
jgi:aminoglycoside phosphotransferase family enzyme